MSEGPLGCQKLSKGTMVLKSLKLGKNWRLWQKSPVCGTNAFRAIRKHTRDTEAMLPVSIVVCLSLFMSRKITIIVRTISTEAHIALLMIWKKK
jgi:hypothetical protein